MTKYNIDISKILDKHLPAISDNEERTKIRLALHQEITELINDALKSDANQKLFDKVNATAEVIQEYNLRGVAAHISASTKQTNMTKEEIIQEGVTKAAKHFKVSVAEVTSYQVTQYLAAVLEQLTVNVGDPLISQAMIINPLTREA